MLEMITNIISRSSQTLDLPLYESAPYLATLVVYWRTFRGVDNT